MAEGQRKAEVSKQPALSSRLMQMKFMQRGKEKTVLKEAAAEQVKEEDESKWTAAAPHSGLMLVAESDPPPGAHMGHMSFSSFNPELQKLQEERDTMLKAAKKTASLGADGKLTSDTEMAERLINLQNGNIDAAIDELEQRGSKAQASNGKRMTSLRESRRKPHKVRRESSAKSGHKRKRRQKL